MREVTQRAILPRFRNLSDGDVIEKASDDLVTIADREAEDMLAEGLAALDPSLAIVGEEAAHADPAVLGALGGDCWIVDPIDGTHNFAHGKPPFGIILAQASGGLCHSGWIYDCLSDRFCHVHRGAGAFVDGERIASRTTGEAPPVAAIARIFLTEEQRALVDARLAPHYRLVDIPRCAAEQYPRLALGENDVSSFKRTLPWDHGAGVLWLNEAGGKAARLDGSEYRVDEHEKPGLIGASTPAIWDEFAKRALAPRD
ncbi:inositol monophosphatase family protein [Altererythrobacter arenosus]|uniref:Inositol monophosphatase family protein n=1 Tax=Altererythrobacter arenosus TaxID=3032592 RepID=A0ABY8FVN6_9SPHN|nr:inositol monophosphatase family protein [Altererythrobacter sp. CAU 1644]WFL79078.1 inositol monophosphatase family protein [Altererythrobacter sp. CAU 1644]